MCGFVKPFKWAHEPCVPTFKAFFLYIQAYLSASLGSLPLGGQGWVFVFLCYFYFMVAKIAYLCKRMKRKIVIISLMALCLGSFAQQAKQDFKADRLLSASNYLAYPGPLQKTLTPAPKGYVPFYLSHYGRHGSRWLIGNRDYQRPVRWLERADSLGKLTPKGQEVLAKLRRISEAARGRDGELTQLGAEQHRGIAERMMRNFPEIFKGKTHVDAKSTTVIRCILSMENALQQLARMNPALEISHDASHHDMYYMNYADTALFKTRMPKEVKATFEAFRNRHFHPERVMRLLFNDDDYWQKQVDFGKLYELLFKQAANLQSTELRHSMSLYDLFNDDEIYDIWQVGNAWWYINFGPSPLNGGRQPTSQRYLLRKIVSEADSCLRLNHPGATLRYGHDTMVMPLTCLLGLDGTGVQVADLEQLPAIGWSDYRIFPMACNLQFVFYRKAGSDDILVKILRNENEAKLPIKTDLYPYYHWKDVRAYCERVSQ